MKTIFPILWTFGALCGIGALLFFYDVSRQVEEVQETASRVVELLEEQQTKAVESLISESFKKFEEDMKIPVPVAAEASPAKSVGEIVINIGSDGRILVNAKELSREELAGRIREISEMYPDQPVILRADQTVKFARIIEVLDVVKEAGIWNVAFATAQATESR